MKPVNIVEKCVVILTLSVILTTSIPVNDSGEFHVVQTFESREDMMFRYRLPNNTIPHLYRISIEPNMEAENFTWIGETNISIEILLGTPLLTLHAYKNLVINNNSTILIDANGTKIKPIEQIRDAEVEFLIVRFDHEVPVGNYTLNFQYSGVDVEDFVGFYRMSRNPNKPKIAGTHFEATTARRAFPCWDEPGLKARFSMTIKHFPNYTAISNMPEIENVAMVDGKVLTTFETTPIMSTYLLTFVIADYGNISNEHGNVTLWCRKDLLEVVSHVLKFSTQVVEVMENYTGLPFGSPRIGSVLLPVYTSGATEHWGLISYREDTITFNRTSDSSSRKDTSDLIVAHELVHSWFGNRVSPVWWDDLWLNEAFASYFEYYIMEMIIDNWGSEELFVLNINYELSFYIDTEESIPIRWTPITNIEIRRLFAGVTYYKGASIVHMFRNVLTDDVFRAGIQKFLVKHSFGAAVANDLMEAFQEAYNEGVNAGTLLNVKEVMTPWLEQSGYPIVNVTRNYTTGMTEVVQESNLKSNNSSNKWWIPLTYATQTDLNFSSTVPSSWISDKKSSATINGISKDDWVIFNIRSSGYYRIIYDEENWNRIADFLNTDNYTHIHVLNRAQLINDAGYLVSRDPERYYTIFYKLTKYLSREFNYLPWHIAKTAVLRLDERLSGTEVHIIFQRYILGLMNTLIEKVGFEKRHTDDHLTILSRTDLVEWACVSGHSGCSEFAAEKLLRIVENGTNNSFDPDTKAFIFCAGIRGLNGTMAKQAVAWALANDEKSLVVKNLGCTENHDIHRDFLAGTVRKNSSTSTEDMRVAYYYITIGSEENFNFAVDFLLQNHEAINTLVHPDGWDETLRATVRTLASEVKTASRMKKFRQVLQLDTVIKTKEIDKEQLLAKIQTDVAKSDELVTKFRKFWDQQLVAENRISNSPQGSS